MTRTGRCSRQTVVHIRATAYRTFDWVEDEILPRNPVRGVKLPPMREVKRERAILTDDELATLLGHAAVDLEIKMLVLISRTVGGLRSGDLNAWTGRRSTSCTSPTCEVPPPRPGKPQSLEVPEPVRPFLRVWWEAQGRPSVGPGLSGEEGPEGRGGEEEEQHELRRPAPPGAHQGRDHPLRAAPRDRDEPHVDFHSTRRAFSTALARVGMNAQTAMALAGHSDPKVHQRYLNAWSGAVATHGVIAGAPLRGRQ